MYVVTDFPVEIVVGLDTLLDISSVLRFLGPFSQPSRHSSTVSTVDHVPNGR